MSLAVLGLLLSAPLARAAAEDVNPERARDMLLSTTHRSAASVAVATAVDIGEMDLRSLSNSLSFPNPAPPSHFLAESSNFSTSRLSPTSFPLFYTISFILFVLVSLASASLVLFICVRTENIYGGLYPRRGDGRFGAGETHGHGRRRRKSGTHERKRSVEVPKLVRVDSTDETDARVAFGKPVRLRTLKVDLGKSRALSSGIRK